jgi:hypothetical protein
VRASTQRFGKIRMTWAEITLDFLIVIACYLGLLAAGFVWNFIFAPARLNRELKHKVGMASLDQVLTKSAVDAVECLDQLMETDEDQEEASQNPK